MASSELEPLRDALFVEIARLHEAYRSRGLSPAVFLHQSLALHGDELTLERVVADVRDELARLAEFEVESTGRKRTL